MYTVAELTKRYGVNELTVLGWINSGQLSAINVGRDPGKQRPRWRISQQAVEAFELARTQTPTPPRAARRKPSSDVVEFYA